MVDFFKKIISSFSSGNDESSLPLEIFVMDLKKSISENELKLIDAQMDFNSLNDSLLDQLNECNSEIEKGGINGVDNKKFIEKRIEKVTQSFVEEVLEIQKSIKECEDSLSLFRRTCASEIEKSNNISKEKFSKSMEDFDKGILKSSSGSKVSDKNQAIAIAMSEAGYKKSTKDEFDCMCKSKEEPNNGDIKSSTREGKKAMVYMDGTWYHFGDSSMKHNYSDEARESATARHSKNLKGSDPRAKAFRVYWKEYWTKGGRVKKGGLDDELYDYTLDELFKGNSNDSVAIIVKDGIGKTLFLKRSSDDDFHPGTWCLPGGGVDRGEDPLDAAVRELEEESNICAKKDELFISDVVQVDGKKIYYYTYHLPNEVDLKKPIALIDGEMSNYEWMDVDRWSEENLILDLKKHLDKIILARNEIVKAFQSQMLSKAFSEELISEDKFNSLKEIL